MGGSPMCRAPDNPIVGSFLRKPLGLFAATLVVGFAVMAVGMEAFGGGSGGAAPPPRPPVPLTKAQFKRAGVRICLSLRPQLTWVVGLPKHKPRNLREVTSDSRRLTSIVDRLTTDLNGLVPPRSVAARYQHLLRKFDTLDRALHRFNHLAETHQWRQLALLARSRWWKNLGKLFGPPRTSGPIRCRRHDFTLA